MSAAFNGSSSRIIRDGGSLGLAFPVAVFGWVKPNSATVNQMVAGLGNTAGTEELMMYAEGAGSGRMRAFQTSAAANSASPISTAWTPCLCLYTGPNSRSIWYGAGAVVTETTDVSPWSLASLNRIGVGNRLRNDSLWYGGEFDRLTIWSGGTALGQAQYDALASGAVPTSVSPATLWDAWVFPGVAASYTGVNGRVLTAFDIAAGTSDPPIGGGGGGSSVGAGLTATRLLQSRLRRGLVR